MIHWLGTVKVLLGVRRISFSSTYPYALSAEPAEGAAPTAGPSRSITMA